MTNISILPGTWRFDDLIADTDDAIYMETNRSWSIDDRRYHFQFSTEIGWEIKGGKKGRMIKNPSYSGITTEFWNSCDAICSRELLDAVGHAELRQRPAAADHGHGPRRGACAFSQCENRSGFRKIMSAARKSKKPARAASAAYHSHPSADFRVGIPELREIASRVFKLSDADETEVEIGAVSDALTRFANNTIHQNVAEQDLALSVRVGVRRPHRARGHQQDGRRFAAARGGGCVEFGARPAARIRICCRCLGSRSIKKCGDFIP